MGYLILGVYYCSVRFRGWERVWGFGGGGRSSGIVWWEEVVSVTRLGFVEGVVSCGWFSGVRFFCFLEK